MLSPSAILNGKILIVDDQEPNVLLLTQMLRGAGYASITSTMQPREVCELHRKNRYDLILLDLQMPGLDGFQVMDALKEMPSSFECYLVETEVWGQMTDPNLMVEISEEDLADMVTATSFHIGEVLTVVPDPQLQDPAERDLADGFQ